MPQKLLLLLHISLTVMVCLFNSRLSCKSALVTFCINIIVVAHGCDFEHLLGQHIKTILFNFVLNWLWYYIGIYSKMYHATVSIKQKFRIVFKSPNIVIRLCSPKILTNYWNYFSIFRIPFIWVIHICITV